MNNIEIMNLEKVASKHCPHGFDWQAETDSTLTYHENKAHLLQYAVMPPIPSSQESRLLHEKALNWALNKDRVALRDALDMVAESRLACKTGQPIGDLHRPHLKFNMVKGNRYLKIVTLGGEERYIGPANDLGRREEALRILKDQLAQFFAIKYEEALVKQVRKLEGD